MVTTNDAVAEVFPVVLIMASQSIPTCRKRRLLWSGSPGRLPDVSGIVPSWADVTACRSVP